LWCRLHAGLLRVCVQLVKRLTAPTVFLQLVGGSHLAQKAQ
jgi:hypothetical protein